MKFVIDENFEFYFEDDILKCTIDNEFYKINKFVVHKHRNSNRRLFVCKSTKFKT